MTSFKLISCAVLLLVLTIISATDLQVGVSVNNELAYVKNVNRNAVPLKVRTKNVFYSRNDTRVIRGISAIDLDAGNAKPTITSGGVGFSFTNIKIKSERGEGLNYQVQIFI
uniref:Uncharacterized protein n=1 Tax=Bombyx mori TaxID=7091 RepID=A0A8R2AT36_BOMMO|nr:uncharacterized protein LOC101742590 [Bombyx mori]